MLIFTESKICNLPHPPPSPAPKRDDEHPLRVLLPLGYSLLLLYDALTHFVNRYMTELLTLAQDGGQRASRS